MRMVSLLLLLVLAACGREPARSHQTDDPLIAMLANKRVLWVAPHADDELFVAPVLGEACVYRRARCTLLLTTQNTGWCPHGPCSDVTDTVALRMAEHRAAAKILNAEPVYLQALLPNTNEPTGGTEMVLGAWSAAAEGYDRLVNAFVRALHEIRPEVVITHDPRHGGSCHPEHRVTAQLMLAAVARSGSAAQVLFSATSIRREDTIEEGIPGPVPFVEEPGLLAYDAHRSLSPEETAWSYMEAVTAVYQSQFSPVRLLAISLVPPSLRRVFVIPAAAVSDVSASLCEDQ